MQAFGKSLKETTLTVMLFRKANSKNVLNSGQLCTSTANSVQLTSQGDFCLVYEEKQRTGMYAEGDADAGRNFGYDEFRVELTPEDISFIVVPNSWDDEIDEDLQDTDEDPYLWIENLREIAPVIFEKEFDGNIDFNF